MTTKILAFLMALEIAAPPLGKGHHSLTAAKYGPFEGPWEYRLLLQVNDYRFFLDDTDFEKPVEMLVQEILGLMTD